MIRRIMLHNLNEDLDENFLSQDDFTILVENIPVFSENHLNENSVEDYDFNLKDYFTQKLREKL